MEKSPKALWDNCLKLIKENVTEQQFRTWFATLVFEQYDEDSRTLLVQVPSRYVYEYLEQYYVQLLSMALRRCFGAQVQLNYRIVVDKKHHLTIDEAGSEPVNIEEPARTERANKAPTALDAAVPQDLNPQLDKHKTFQSFIEGDSNKLPRTVGVAIAEHPGNTQLYFQLRDSLGKNHVLLHSKSKKVDVKHQLIDFIDANPALDYKIN